MCHSETCGDNRFEIIEKAKEHLLERTNIETNINEMKCLDSFLFRCWQMGWLNQYDKATKIEKDSTVDISNLYEINKAGYKKVRPYNEADFSNALVKVEDWFKDKKYTMLLCKERSDYTVFNFCGDDINYAKTAQQDLKECLDNRGKCLDIKYDETLNAFEVWMKIKDEVFMYYLFECNDFVIEE